MADVCGDQEMSGLIPRLDGSKVIGAADVAIFESIYWHRFRMKPSSEELEMALVPDLHDPGLRHWLTGS